MAFKQKGKEKVEVKVLCGTCGKPVSDKARSDVTRFLFRESRCNCITPDLTQQVSPDESSDNPPDETPAAELAAFSENRVRAQELKLGDRYQILSLLGEGGVGTVFKVKDTLIDKVFAVKVLHDNLVMDRNAVMRFQQEAKAASKLNHPHLVSVYYFGVAESGAPYLVMDYIEGQSLSDVLKKEGRLEVPRALDIFVEVCEAMAYAHSENVIHRDIKPSNIIVTPAADGMDYVKLVDFGIAKVLPQPGHETQHLTQTGEIFGSPLWMSPEQCMGNKLDFRSDIYSLGCVMYEALTGTPPFAGENAIKTIFKHINEPPRPMGAVAKGVEIPPDLEALITRALEKDPADRYQSMGDLLKDLKSVREGKQLPRHKKARSLAKSINFKNPRFRNAYIAAMTLVVILTGVQMFQPLIVTPLNAQSDAQRLDSLSYRYFTSGQYEKAIPLLEFGLKTYRETGKQDLYLADNLQHVGKCYLMLGKYDEAKPYYEEALSIYRRFGPKGTMMPEAQADYARVLAGLEQRVSPAK